ncbi:peptidase inhibitor family I36 protein [Streptomyces netropsis]|uniref:peptidase inhibitor family I36 protein n=1 Tax=Streptomyces netropsis TaxID=55404 RepID=UPI0037B44617
MHRMVKMRGRRVFMMGAAALTLAVASITSAQAQQIDWPACDSGYICYWDQEDFQGNKVTERPWALSGCFYTPIHAKSIYNNTSNDYAFYSDDYCESFDRRVNHWDQASRANAKTIRWV